jgi:lipopolysaccharide export system permease protein
MNKIMILDKYLFRQFIPIFFVAISLFVFLILLIDLFSNLVRYLSNEVSVITILKISFFYIPKCISYAMPMSLLFAAAYTLGDLYSKNELTSIFATGIPLWRFSMSFVVIGLAASVFSFYLDDKIVIPTLKRKNELSRRALNNYIAENNSDIVIIAKKGNVVYWVDYFDSEKNILNGVNIIDREKSAFVSRIKANSAEWNDSYWELKNAVIYRYDEDGKERIVRIYQFLSDEKYNEHPDIFRKNSVNVEELSAKEAGLLIKDLRLAGYSYRSTQANYYHRYSFAATSLIVMILSISMGGRFRKNILLMSLFTSLSVAVVYYIAEMLCMTMAELNYIHPFVGAWFPVVIFIVIGVHLLRSAKT